MATELFMKRRLSSLVPTNRMSEELLRNLPEHVTLKIVATQPRNPKHHAKFMALIAAIYPHQSIYPTMDSFRKAITVALGYGDTVKLPDGRVMLIPGSISFAKMDQRAFEEFYERAVTRTILSTPPECPVRKVVLCEPSGASTRAASIAQIGPTTHRASARAIHCFTTWVID